MWGWKSADRLRLPPGYAAIGLGLVLAWATAQGLIVSEAWRSRDHAIEALLTAAQHATESKAREMSQLLADVYVATRTISLLPAVRRPVAQNRKSAHDDAIDGRRFNDADAQTVMQLYQHLADVLSVSEVYIVYDGFAPERGEVPFLMFDSVIVERFRKLTGTRPIGGRAEGGGEAPDEYEAAEYAELVRQLDYLRQNHPLLPDRAPRDIAFVVSPPLLTCDNSQFLSAVSSADRDRTGLMISVPIYDQSTQGFKGLVTTVVRLNVLEARLLDWPMIPVTPLERAQLEGMRLPSQEPAEYVLENRGVGIRVTDRRNAALVEGAQVAAGRVFHRPLEGFAGGDWELSRHVSAARIEAIRAAARSAIAWRSAMAALVFAGFAIVGSLLMAQRRAASRLAEMADYDALTGLPNRRQLDRLMEAQLQSAAVQCRHLTLVMIDLDNFKSVNDTHGHDVGDQLLVEASRRFQKQLAGVAGRDAVAPDPAVAPRVGRLGGDEFLVIWPHAADDDAAAAVGERLLETLAVPMILDGRSIPVRASLGVAVFPLHGRTPAQLLRAADQAMYAAKRIENSAVVVHQRDVDHAAVRRMRLTADLREALVREQFELHYQCVVSVPRMRVESTEALMRWHHPELGWVSPGEFVPLLERSGLIVPVGLWALRKACEQVNHWRVRGSSIGSVSVNVSVVQLAQSDFADDALRIIASTGTPPASLTMEVTESVLMDNSGRSLEQLVRLRAAGVRVAIDDFGAGYSSLGYLRRLPVQVVKIDRSLLIDAVGPTGRAILGAVVQLAGELGLDCIAEGVETIEQFELLSELGCHRLQGYLFARPMPAADADAAARRMRAPRHDGNGELFTPSCFGQIDSRFGSQAAPA